MGLVYYTLRQDQADSQLFVRYRPGMSSQMQLARYQAPVFVLRGLGVTMSVLWIRLPIVSPREAL